MHDDTIKRSDAIEALNECTDRYDYYGTGWEWLNESGADYWQADWNHSILAWMPLPAPWEGAANE